MDHPCLSSAYRRGAMSTGGRSRKPPISHTARGKGWGWPGWHGAEGVVIAGSGKNCSESHISREKF